MRRYLVRTLWMIDPEFEVVEAENGVAALAAAGRRHPDLIITDLNMPVMGGKELIASLARDPVLATTPVLIISADRSDAQLEQLIRDGAAGFLAKPVTPEQLRQHLTEIFHSEAGIRLDPAMPVIV
jgi:two-component system chemotaxis response regulator CheY